ncbi:MAG TPA: DUF4974 domain-containing protein [Pirellulaceae bacterium]
MQAVSPAAFCSGAILSILSFASAADAQTWLYADDDVGRHEQELELALNRRGSVAFVEAPLRDVAAQIARQFQIPIVLAIKKLEEAGISPDTPVTIRLDDLTLESILQLTLKTVELEFTIRDEVFVISSPEDIQSQLLTRIYPALDLVVMPIVGSKAVVEVDYDSLIELITTTIKPDSWDDVGGPAAIDSFDNAKVLVVSQTQEVHREIERLLISLRRAKNIQGIPSLAAPTKVSRPVSAAQVARPAFLAPASAMPAWQLPHVYK